MGRFLRQHWRLASFVAAVVGYAFVTSGISGVRLANWGPPPGPLGNAVSFVVFGLIFSIPRLSFPSALHEGRFAYGTYALLQLPLVLAVAVVVMIVLRILRRKSGAIVLGGVLAWMAAMLITNELAFAFSVDYSNDFPIGKQLGRLDWRDKPTIADVRRVVGYPLAEAVFASTDITLPKTVLDNMSAWKRKEALIYAYQENDKWRRTNIYYVMFDPQSGQHFSTVSFYQPVSDEYWPNKAAPGKGGIPLLFHAGRPRPALPEQQR